MTQAKTTQRSDHQDAASPDRRHTDRVPTSFGLMYSALDKADVLIGDGTVTDLSSGGLGIRGNQSVKPGMDLTLFLYLPDGDDPLFILEASVAWAKGRHFGVRFTQLSLREGKRLHAFLRR
jgi:hypothetical protein